MRKATIGFWMLVFLVVGLIVAGCAPRAQIQDRSKPVIVARENKASKVESGSQATAGKCEKPTLEKEELLWFQSKFGVRFAHSRELQPREYDNSTGRSIEVSYADADSPEIIIVFLKSDDSALEYATRIAADFKDIKPVAMRCPLGVGYKLTTDVPSDIGKGITNHFYVRNGEELLWVFSSSSVKSTLNKSPFDRCIETLTSCKVMEVK